MVQAPGIVRIAIIRSRCMQDILKMHMRIPHRSSVENSEKSEKRPVLRHGFGSIEKNTKADESQ